jgi:hypothetical protein
MKADTWAYYVVFQQPWSNKTVKMKAVGRVDDMLTLFRIPLAGLAI